jgi:hypothetical protein
VLSSETATQIVTALAIVVHTASLNLDRGRLDVVRLLAQSSSALASLGTALRTGHSEGHCAVLLDPRTADNERDAMVAALDHLAKGWLTSAEEQAATVRVLTAASAILASSTAC